jgi:MFS family permease
MTAPIAPVYASSLGASPLTVGLIAASNVALPLVLALHIGAAADRLGATRVARGAAVLAVCGYGLVAVGRTLELLAVAMAIMGLADLGLIVAAQTYVAVTSSAQDRDRDFAQMALWMSFGALIGPVAGGVLADAWGYRSAFAGSVVLAATTLALALRLPASRERAGLGDSAAAVPAGTAPLLPRALALLREPGVGLVLLMSGALMFGMSVRHSFLPLYLREAGLSTTSMGLIFSSYSLCQMAVRPIIAAGVRWIRHAGVLAIALGTAALGIALTPWLGSFWTLTLAVSLLGAGTGITQPLTMSLVSGRATPSARGLAIGVRMTVNQLAQVIGPPILGVVVGAWGLGAAFHVAAVAAATGFAWLRGYARLDASPPRK